MAIDPSILTPSPGVNLATATSAAPALLRPKRYDCLGGVVPTIPTAPVNALSDAMRTAFQRAQGNIAAAGGSIFVIGDSQLQLQDVSQISPYAVNFAIGGNGVAAYLNLLNDYTALRSAGGVVLSISQIEIAAGVSLATCQDYYSRILGWLTGPLVLFEAMPFTSPTYNSSFEALNAYVRSAVSGRSRCETVSIRDVLIDGSGNLPVSLTWQGDGQHMTDPGKRIILAERIRSALGRVTAI